MTIKYSFLPGRFYLMSNLLDKSISTPGDVTLAAEILQGAPKRVYMSLAFTIE
jgi:hypothetical protein